MTIYSKQNPPAGFYVYAYLRSNGTPYYIGKGERQRAWKPHRRLNRSDLKPKNTVYVTILESNLTEVGALALERRYIEWYGRKDLGTGILRNLTNGGDGCAGRVLTDSHKENIGKANKGRMPCLEAQQKAWAARTGAVDSQETKDRKSRAAVGKPKEIVTCTTCGKQGGLGAMRRWHFESCTAI